MATEYNRHHTEQEQEECTAAVADLQQPVYDFPAVGNDIAVYARDEGGKMRGGLIGNRQGEWLNIKYLWVSDEKRGSGLGRQLMDAAEGEARRPGLPPCAGGYLQFPGASVL
ncbi:Uncharacterised protein [Leclercia adecarboxylata]|uniref:N-acetyltransferase domain-containing protein n=1 Tax=Leclercia adecarboxylata TaxID=83655 RepID=A0A4U9HDE7_9ENTR|nr:Uncharacterised protein [Leclercia adecarboxylata]